MNYDLNDNNVTILAIKHYDTKNCLMSEFEEDFKRVKYIKRLIGKYKVSGEIKDRLLLNHIVILGNSFGPEFTTKLLFLKIEDKYYDVLKPFLLYLQFLPDEISTINGRSINTRLIPLDPYVVNLLRKI